MNKKNEGRLILFLLIGLIAFGLGSALGIVMGISGDDFLHPEEANVVNNTKEVVIYQANATMEEISLDDGVISFDSDNKIA